MAKQFCNAAAKSRVWPVIRGLGGRDTELLSRLPMFAGLDATQVVLLLDNAQVKIASRRTVLFHQGEPAVRFYIVLEGCVMLHRVSPNGHDAVISLINRGESFAEAAMFDNAEFPVTATVITDARLLVVTAQSFIRRLREDPSLGLNILASMSRQLRRLVEQIEQRASSSSTERLAGFLLRLCPLGVSSIHLELPLDKQLIAGALGMQPETFSRSLSRLRRLGVTCHGNHVTIDNIEGLRRLVDGEASPGRAGSSI
jgi:CRP/FNR family transcriptional regulator, dissimilatory nitrate respiration regulator